MKFETKVTYDFVQQKLPVHARRVLEVGCGSGELAARLHHHGVSVVAIDSDRDCVAAARPVYELLGAKEKLAANFPDCGHDFPPEARKVAYEWLDRWLK